MDRSDWIGLSTSLGVHVIMLALFALMTGLQPEPQPLGFVEVEFGEFAEGRPVQSTPEPEEESASEPTEPQPELEEPPEEPPTEAEEEPVDLPDEEVEATESVLPQDEEAIPPEQVEEEAEEASDEENLSEEDTGAESGDPGEGTSEEESAPYDIEGLDRDPVYAPLPQYAEQVDATIRVRVTVSPRGEIVQRIPLLKGNPTLERAVMETLRRWRFNALPANAPQENQTGIVTFRFRLE